MQIYLNTTKRDFPSKVKLVANSDEFHGGNRNGVNMRFYLLHFREEGDHVRVCPGMVTFAWSVGPRGHAGAFSQASV